jgi:hypothetical protein
MRAPYHNEYTLLAPKGFRERIFVLSGALGAARPAVPGDPHEPSLLHRRAGGPGSAHAGGERLYVSYRPELIALIGEPAYERLAQLCAEREKQGQLAPHPATVEATG